MDSFSLNSFLISGDLPRSSSESLLSRFGHGCAPKKTGELLTAKESPDSADSSDSSRLKEVIRTFLQPDVSVEMKDAPELHQDTRHKMSQLIAQGQNAPSVPMTGHSIQPSTHFPSLVSLKSEILAELENHPAKLLSLNPSRREGVAQYLDRLAGMLPAPSMATGAADAAGGLRRWIEGPRTPAQNGALQAYFEEVALISLGQALLLKAWSDRGYRKWSENDVGRLNWVLSSALKPHIPLDRDGWQITRPNLYSWYNPSAGLQRKIWSTLEDWRISEEGPHFLSSLMSQARQLQWNKNHQDPQGYDHRFTQAIWNQMPQFGLDPAADTGPLKRARTVFSPTLREGAVVRSAPAQLVWIGTECSAYQLMMAELVQLWWGPTAPPLWMMGNGLEAHSRDQLSLDLGSPKPSLLSRIAEMEACDASFVLEEKIVRSQGRGADAQRFRQQLEALPYFRKLRGKGTSLGDLQACVAMSKLRPGGLLWWTREEPLSEIDGTEALNFLLDRGKLVCEWDFEGLDHTLPSALPLFPKRLYLFVREPRIEERITHRPLRVSLHGSIRSHVEIPFVFEDALKTAAAASAGTGTTDNPASFSTSHLQIAVPTRGQWKIHLQKSPTCQKDWSEKWPDPASHSAVRSIEKLRSISLPLAHATTIRPTPLGDPTRQNQWMVQSPLKGFWLQIDEKRIVTHSIPIPGQDTSGDGFMVLVPDESWIAPLRKYLESPIAQSWLEHHAERKGERLILTEQLVKWISIPRVLLRTLGFTCISEFGEELPLTLPLPGPWEKLASDFSTRGPSLKSAQDALAELTDDENGLRIQASLFVRAARAIEYFQTTQSRLFSVVTPEGKVRWRELLEILPKTECVAVPFHPRIRLTGNLAPHLPIGRIDRVKMPTPGILLSTESGMTLHVGSDHPRLVEMLYDQVEGLTHPTWNELVRYLRLPRRIELAEATAGDVLRSHGEQSIRLQELNEFVNACKFF